MAISESDSGSLRPRAVTVRVESKATVLRLRLQQQLIQTLHAGFVTASKCSARRAGQVPSSMASCWWCAVFLNLWDISACGSWPPVQITQLLGVEPQLSRPVHTRALAADGAAAPAATLQARWFQQELWIPLAEWWVDTVLGTWEEGLKSLIREAFANATRLVNGFFSWVVAALPRERALSR